MNHDIEVGDVLIIVNNNTCTCEDTTANENETMAFQNDGVIRRWPSKRRGNSLHRFEQGLKQICLHSDDSMIHPLSRPDSSNQTSMCPHALARHTSNPRGGIDAPCRPK